MSPSGGLDRAQRTAACQGSRSSVVLKCRVAPISTQESSTGLAMSGSVAIDSAHGLGSIRWVSMPRCASAVTISSPSGVASTTTAFLHRVEDLVPLHRLPDVLHPVQAAEIAAGDTRVGVVEPGRHDQGVVRHLLALDRHQACPGVDGGHGGLVADVDALVDVLLLGAEEKSLEIRDLPAVHVRDPARAVCGVLELGVDGDFGPGVRALGRPGRTHAGGAASDDDDAPSHPRPPTRRRL